MPIDFRVVALIIKVIEVTKVKFHFCALFKTRALVRLKPLGQYFMNIYTIQELLGGQNAYKGFNSIQFKHIYLTTVGSLRGTNNNIQQY